MTIAKMLWVKINLYKECLQISTSNHMFKREIWDKFTEFTFLEF